LHGEGEIGQPFVARQGFARYAQRTRINALGGTAMRRGYAVPEPAAPAQARDQIAAKRIHVRPVVQVRDVLLRPSIEIGREHTLRRIEERPVEVGLVAHRGRGIRSED